MLKYKTLTNAEIRSFIATEHRWELRKGVLICFGIDPSSFDWEEDLNANPVRVWNWCCHVLNGGEHEYRKGQPKLTPVNQISESFSVLRDTLIAFTYSEWPNFVERTYKIWKSYREERDGAPVSDLKKKCIHEMRLLAVRKFKEHEYAYRHGKKFLTKEGLAKELGKQNGQSPNTIRSYCSDIDLSLKWVMENSDYHDIS